VSGEPLDKRSGDDEPWRPHVSSDVVRKLVDAEQGLPWWLILAAVLVIAVSVLILLLRRLDDNQDVRKERPAFVRAFRRWQPVLDAAKHSLAPRAIKRFTNKTRYFVMRSMEDSDLRGPLERFVEPSKNTVDQTSEESLVESIVALSVLRTDLKTRPAEKL